MPSLNGKYWRSLDELADSAEFREILRREFPAAAEAETWSTASRRSFLKLMGASVALAGLTACHWPREHIVPYAHRPEGRDPGEPEQYATAMELGGAALGLVVTSVDGRPIKVEGNPRHPESLGGTTPQAQASILELYDPERSREVVQHAASQDVKRTFDDFVGVAGPLFAGLRGRGGQGLHILVESLSSPSLAALRARLAQVAPQAAWHEYEPISRDDERTGLALAFGRPLRANYALAGADVIVALDSNFLCDHPASTRLAREFAGRRHADDGTMSRVWAIEPVPTPTGAVADERHAVPALLVPVIAMRIAASVLGGATPPWAGAVLPALERAARHPYSAPFVDALAKDLLAHRGRGVVLAGAGQPPEVHALAHLVNAALGNVGRTVTYAADPDESRPSHQDAIVKLTEAMRSGAVDTLLVIGANPVYTAPVDLRFGEALTRVKNTIHLGLYRDETGRACAWHVPRAHALESWSDARAWDGTVSIVQPLIDPLFGGKTPEEMLALVLSDGPRTAHDIVRDTFRRTTGGGDKEWRAALRRGVIASTAWPAVTSEPSPAALGAKLDALAAAAPTTEALELVFRADARIHDGRFANNAWLQELPDPITRITWDNALLVEPGTAQKLDLANEELVRLHAGARRLDAAVCIVPGVAPGTLGLALGYGRTAAGSVGDNGGFNAYELRETGAPRAVGGITIEKTLRRYRLASTQNHWAIDRLGREEASRRAAELVREATLDEYRGKPGFAKEGQEEFHSLWHEFKYEGHAWAASIDLSRCTGCGACAVACQAENNIPVVGKDQVLRGREMNWLRVDRYYSGDPDHPEIVFQPMFCVHCENAPCEQVCPVGATVHSEEGVNQQVYNRCVGTRYCSNNCPYKVRRFNFYNYNRNLTELQMMQRNPEVTVRSRGVMEKCTFCIQRIERVKIRAKNSHLPINDGDIVTACAQACPAQAIAFGDLNDAQSEVRRRHEHRRSYALLAELNVKPRTHFMARIKNPAPGTGAGTGEHA